MSDETPTPKPPRKKRMTEKRKMRELQRRIQAGEVQIDKPRSRGGRPKGHRLSEETKAKISRSRMAAKVEGGPFPPASNPDLPMEVLRMVYERDGGKCYGCHAKYTVKGRDGKVRIQSSENIKVYSFPDRRDVEEDITDLSRHVVLCQFCRDNAKDMGCRTIEEMTHWPSSQSPSE